MNPRGGSHFVGIPGSCTPPGWTLGGCSHTFFDHGHDTFTIINLLVIPWSILYIFYTQFHLCLWTAKRLCPPLFSLWQPFDPWMGSSPYSKMGGKYRQYQTLVKW